MGLTTALVAQDAAPYFRQNCASCHTIGGGRLTGPDLKNVHQRQDRGWLARFVANPKAMIDAGDPYATRLKEEARDVVMPSLPTLKPELVQALLDLLETESLLDKSQFVGLAIGDEPFTPAQIAHGSALFLGTTRLSGGGAPCMSCHTVNGLSGLSGGRLGPDLTLVYERLQGRKALASWLNAPATTTMQPLFAGKPITQDEILALTAFLEDVARTGGQDTSPAPLNLFIMGLVGTMFILAVFEFAWKKRFRAVRRPQVESSALTPEGRYPKATPMTASSASRRRAAETGVPHEAH